MALRPFYKTEDLIPEDQKSFYISQGDIFVLDVESTEGWSLEDVSAVKKALSSERTKNKKLSEAVKVFEGLDAAEARSAIEKLAELGDLDELEDKDKESIKLLEEQLTKKFDGNTKKLIEKHDSDLKAEQDRSARYWEEVKRSKISEGIASAVARHGGNLKLLGPYLEREASLVETDDERLEVHILDSDGQPRLTRAPGQHGNMDWFERVGMLKEEDDFSSAFKPIEASGTGATSGAKVVSTGVPILSRADALDRAKYVAAKEVAKAAGYEFPQISDE